MITTELKKLSSKAQTIRSKAKDSFDKLELETRSTLEELKGNFQPMLDQLEQQVDDTKIQISNFFKSDEFLKVDAEQAQFDTEARAEFKYHCQWSPADMEDVINMRNISWNAKKAAAALRQDRDKHMVVTPVSVQDKWTLQRMVLESTGGNAAKLLEKLDQLEAEQKLIEVELNNFDEKNEFYDIILN